MFLKKLYYHNKVLFFAVIAFLAAYFYLNYKWGISATPVQQYGMFSGRFSLQDTLQVYQVKANGRWINNARVSVIERDLIQSFPDYYMSENLINREVYTNLEPYLFIGGLISETSHQHKFFNRINDTLFTAWYKARITGIIHEKVNSLEVYRQLFTWKHSRLNPIDTPAKLNFIVAL